MDKILQMLFGEGFNLAEGFGKEGLMGMIGSEGFANLLKGGTDLMSGLQTGDMLDFQKDRTTRIDKMNEEKFDSDMKSDENRTGAFDDAAKILGF